MPLVVQDLGVRDCFVPRPGCCFIDADIEALELCTLGQVEIWTINDRTKADQLNDGVDPHSLTGTKIHAKGLTWKQFKQLTKTDKAAKNIRNLAKVPNFGKPGGMADDTLVSFARTSYGIKLGATAAMPRPPLEASIVEARRIGQFWRDANPNDQAYLDFIRTTRRGERYEVIIGHPSIGTIMRRGRATYCAAANSLFQGLGAIAAGEITWEIQKACYNTPSSPLYGWRLVVHAYDEWLLEGPIAGRTAAGKELVRIIKEAGARKVPDVGFRADPVAMNRWIKAAETVWCPSTGELMIWGTEACANEFARQKELQAAA